MAATPASLGLYQAPVPGTSYLHASPSPAASRLGGQPSRVPSDAGASNAVVSHHWVAVPWRNGEERLLTNGMQLFGARAETLNKKVERRNLVSHALLNQILRDGFAHYRNMVKAQRDPDAHAYASSVSPFRMQELDNIRPGPANVGAAQTTGNPRALEGVTTPTSYFAASQQYYDRDRVVALLDYEADAYEGREYVPDERTIWRAERAEQRATRMPKSLLVGESDEVRRLLERYRGQLDGNVAQELQSWYDEVAARDEAADRIVREFSRIKTTHARYATREGIETYWNYFGTIVETMAGLTNQIASTAPVTSINAIMHGPAEVLNIWGDDLRAAEDHLYLLLRARRDPANPLEPGSIAKGQPFEIVPYVAKHRQVPTSELAYYDLGGRLRYGRAWFVGRVRYDTETTRPYGRRVRAAGLHAPASYHSAVEALATLDLVNVLQRVV